MLRTNLYNGTQILRFLIIFVGYIQVVSGDADAAVPFVGTERWIDCLGRNVVKDWSNWMLDGDVVSPRLKNYKYKCVGMGRLATCIFDLVNTICSISYTRHRPAPSLSTTVLRFKP